MLNKLFAVSFSTLVCFAAYAENDLSCKVEFAVSTPPVQLIHSVAFNVNSVDSTGPNKSLTVRGGSAPQTIDSIACFNAYTISATLYSTPSNLATSPIGQCTLKAGDVSFNNSGDSVSVVFPNDFICNQG
ncbi:hypothetical protein [Legionella brunensis]|uniref:Uncharacterized protein n=1 Tax=Legionella brunensis TaxID=29422 RepID=A0A0W0SQ94_9GAMM|nr:hypothetical protein [Legionella brunensis]KTC85515.1 hypothetical protein Lbru_0880 [Legionella brunensis]